MILYIDQPRLNHKINKIIENSNIKYDQRSKNYIIKDNDPRWPEIHELIKKQGDKYVIFSEFEDKECNRAKWLMLDCLWLHGYPMPDDDGGYMELTYNIEDCCSKCGNGVKQKAPFRMRGEPPWGKRHFMQLNWIFSEHFTQPDIWEKIFKPIGIDKIPVLKYRTDQALETVVQLKIDQLSPSLLIIPESFTIEKCKVCGKIKYNAFLQNGYFPKFKNDPDDKIKILKTKEIWGSGGLAFQYTIIHQSLYQEMMKHQLKGVRFIPLES